MTTIAFKDGIVAYESRITEGSLIADDNINKMTKVDGLTFFLCGDVAGEQALIRSYVTGEVTDEDAENATYSMAWVVDGGIIYRLLIVDGELFTEPQRQGNIVAMGSGSHFALGAMDAGASAKEAVKIAIGRDVSSGGTIRTFKVK
jgi:20S proteasome alpha/beta subunit